ncbi:MAG: hypothetical protein WBP67_15715 [Thermoanaerobaculia bacterium]
MDQAGGYMRNLKHFLGISLLVLVMTSSPVKSTSPASRASCPQTPPTLDEWPSAQDLSDFNQWMACLGMRMAGTQSHRDLLEQIDRSLGSLVGADTLSRDVCTVRFKDWRATGTSLTLGASTNIPVVGYMPFSGLTADEGVTAELVFQKPAWWKRFYGPLNLLSPLKIRKKHEGKIVAFWVRSVKIPKWLLKMAARKGSDFDDWAPYRRPITIEKTAPCLNKAREKGVKGVVLVLDMSRPHAEGHYLPFTRSAEPVRAGVPGIHVAREDREELERHAKNNGSATLKLEGDFCCKASSDHLIYTLPGAHSGLDDEEIILVQTHTDGPGAVEENGVMALIALAHRFASVPQAKRKRTIVFLFATGHFVKEIEGAKELIWEDPPEWFAKTKAAVAIEHFGSKEWVDAKTGYAVREKDGKELDEPALLFVPGGKHPLEKTATDILPKDRRVVIPMRGRTKFVFGRKFFGEGQYVACSGVPTVGYVPNPDYMFSSANPGGPGMPGHFEKLDPTRMLEELEAFHLLIKELVTGPLAGWPDVTPDVARCKEPKNSCGGH